MSVSLCRRLCDVNVYNIGKCTVRHAHRMRGRPPTEARTLEQRMKKDEVYSVRVDIGLPAERYKKADGLGRLDHVKKMKKDENLESLARNKELFVDLEDVKREWLKNRGPEHIKTIADHYGVYNHLYDEGYFLSRVPLNIGFSYNDGLCPVYFGNVIKPKEAQIPPDVVYEADKGSLWTLMLTNLDGNFMDSDKEYVHWCVTNIPENDVTKGDTAVEYLQPIPPKGTGFHRYVFVLYKQNKKVDYNLKRVKQLDPLINRTFKTRDWYKKHQEDITPAGLAFFQSDWDTSLKDFFHYKLNMKEPTFEYDFPKPYLKPQTWFPLREAFNLYMDRYRDPKQIGKEYLMRKLKVEHPFMKPEPPLKFPLAQAFLKKDTPSWLKLQEKKNRIGWGRIKEIP